jgi:hypothetical protein
MAASLTELKDGMNFRPFMNCHSLMIMDTKKFQKFLT